VTRWNPLGTGALLSLQTSVDATGQSYYGTSQLHLWTSSSPSEVVAVPLPREGPVHAVRWLPHPDKPASFVAIAGNMPAMCSQHHGQTGKPVFLYGNASHRNTVAFSPHGRFLCLAGFGNLAGGMSFWDVNKRKLLPHCADNASGRLRARHVVVQHEWSPDSRTFVAATAAPRQNVENGLQLFRYTGEEITTVPWKNEDYRPNRLLQVEFVPAPLGTYPDRPQSPPPPPDGATATGGEAGSVAPAAAAAASSSAPPSQPAAGRAYVPPGARNRVGAGGGTSLAERLRREKEGQTVGATRVVPGSKTALAAAAAAGGSRVVVGMTAPEPAGKSKSALKREKQKQKKKQQEETKAEQQQQQQQQPAQPPPPQVQEPQTVDPEKRARKLNKTLKQIEELKKKDADDLNDDQRAKLASEEEVRKELEQLGL
jgi:translation initiation factor 2A